MGGSFSNQVNINTQITNDMLQSTTQICNADCKASANNNTIIISGATINGSIGINARCTASAACAMSNASNAAVNNIIQNIIDQETTSVSDIMGDLSWEDINNEVNINTSLSNYITQITSQTCNATADVQANDNFFYVGQGGTSTSDGKTTINGDIFISAEGNATANCSMSNISKLQAYNESQNSVTQSITNVGMFAAIGLMVAVVVLIGGLIYLMMYSRSAFAGPVDPLQSGQLDPDVINLYLKKGNTSAPPPTLSRSSSPLSSSSSKQVSTSTKPALPPRGTTTINTKTTK